MHFWRSVIPQPLKAPEITNPQQMIPTDFRIEDQTTDNFLAEISIGSPDVDLLSSFLSVNYLPSLTICDGNP
jgi:hypothetical protein